MILRTKTGRVEKRKRLIFRIKRPKRVFGSAGCDVSIISASRCCSDASMGIRVSATHRDASSEKVTVRA